MNKVIIGLLVGMLIGGFAAYHIAANSPAPSRLEAPDRVIESVTEISVAEAEAHRVDRYASIKTIEDTLALPTDFAETEALYVIAGRADTFGVQDLIQQALSIADRNDRRAALSILLLRLTELDPYAALEIARDPALGNSMPYERTVWTTWGRLDLDEALAAAKNGTFEQKNTAAQALFRSVRNFDAEKIELINASLGINPGREMRSQQIYALADASPAEAIRYIESHGSVAAQREEFGWLAYYMSRHGDLLQSNYAELIQSDGNRKIFEQSLASYGAQSNPAEALEQFIADPSNPQLQATAHAALRNLSQQDPEGALAYLERIPDKSMREGLAMAVVQILATTDPQRALAWARENETTMNQPSLVATIVGQIAQTDPQLALTEAQAIQNSESRAQAVMMAVSFSAHSDPAAAANMLELVTDANTRRNIVGQLGQQWAEADLDGAVQWVATLSPEDQKPALQGMLQRLVHADVERAIALTERFPAGDSSNLRIRIANSLAQGRSIEAAQSYISRFEGNPEYSRLQTSVVSAVAQNDPDRAMRMAASIQDSRQRDQLYSSIVGRKAVDDPQVALQWMESISNSAYRQQAISQIASAWNNTNPGAAERWLQSLPRGATRDDAVVAVVATGRTRADGGADSLRLIDTIGDAAKRKMATMTLVQRLMYTNTAEAERLLSTIELTDSEQLQYQQMLEHAQYSGRAIDF